MTMNAGQASDAQLVAWMIEGEEGCVGELVARYGGALGALLRRVMGPHSDWEDVAQETWIRVVRHATGYNPDFAFATWLFRIAWNLAMNHLGARRHEALPPESDATPDPAPHPEAQAITTAEQQRLRDGLRALPPALGELLALRYFEELTERELAQRLQIPAGTVKSRLHHAHRKLAALLGVNP